MESPLKKRKLGSGHPTPDPDHSDRLVSAKLTGSGHWSGAPSSPLSRRPGGPTCLCRKSSNYCAAHPGLGRRTALTEIGHWRAAPAPSSPCRPGRPSCTCRRSSTPCAAHTGGSRRTAKLTIAPRWTASSHTLGVTRPGRQSTEPGSMSWWRQSEEPSTPLTSGEHPLPTVMDRSSSQKPGASSSSPGQGEGVRSDGLHSLLFCHPHPPPDASTKSKENMIRMQVDTHKESNKKEERSKKVPKTDEDLD